MFTILDYHEEKISFNINEVIIISYAEKARSCVACGHDFLPEDDVVFCPECGAPHHKACWQAKGHCHYEAAHGTELQWQPPKESEPVESTEEKPEPNTTQNPVIFVNGITMTKCPGCGHFTPCGPNNSICRNCGHPIQGHANSFQAAASAANQSNPFSQNAETENNSTIDGVATDKIARVIMQRRDYYMPRFQGLKKQGHKIVSWNWSAFFLPSYWLAFRKCYLWSAFAAFFDLLSVLLMYPMTGQIASYISANQVSYSQAMQHFVTDVSFTPTVMLLAQGALLVLLVRSIIFGLLGNYIYKKDCLKRIEQLDAMPPDEANFRVFRFSGVNIFAPVIVYYLVSIIQSLLIHFI